MASYTNLASLAGLQPGDIVTYDTATTIDLKKYDVVIRLQGIGYSTSIRGGQTEFHFISANLPSQTVTYTPLYGVSLCYGSSADKYYRIAVAGNSGGPRSNSGKGGGTTGASGSSDSSSSLAGTSGGGGGGTQTAGGSGGSASGGLSSSTKTPGIAGAFGRHSSTNISSGIDQYDYYMAGWYSGGLGGSCYTYSSGRSYSTAGGNGGGSGFIIGQTTTTYPSGYMGNDSSLIAAIASAIPSGEYNMSQGTSPRYTSTVSQLPTTGRMEIEILALPPSSFPQYFDGYEWKWKDTEWKYFDGSAWKDIELKYYDGSTWKDVG